MPQIPMSQSPEIEQKADPNRLFESLKSVAKAATAKLSENPEMISAPLGMGVGALLGRSLSDDKLKGALAGAVGGGGLTYALTQILKNPSPAVPAKKFEELPESGLLTTVADHPLSTAAIVAPPAAYAAYKIRKALPNGNQEGLLTILRKYATGDPEKWGPTLQKLPKALDILK